MPSESEIENNGQQMILAKVNSIELYVKDYLGAMNKSLIEISESLNDIADYFKRK